MSIDIIEKIINWKVSLNDRIEGCTCISLCGNYVIVGCYDGHLYVLSTDNGQIFWKFKTDDIVKCTPVIDPYNGHVWFGGYDKILYELDIYNKCIIGKFQTDGAILASPIIDIKNRILYCCNLRGILYSIDLNNTQRNNKNKINKAENTTIDYKYKWKFSTEDNKPIFTNPKLSQDKMYIYFGCVDGYVYCINTTKEKLVSFNPKIILIILFTFHYMY